MDFDKVITARRSIRRYEQKSVADEDLRNLIDWARFAPSGGNCQKLRFLVIRNAACAEKIFAQTAWAKLVYPRRSPVWGKDAPQTFIALTAEEKDISSTLYADAGAAVQNILLGACSLGLGTCWIGAFNKEKVHEILGLETSTRVVFLVAVGYSAEDPVGEETDDENNVQYYLDENDRLHVPKLTVEKICKWI